MSGVEALAQKIFMGPGAKRKSTIKIFALGGTKRTPYNPLFCCFECSCEVRATVFKT